jgi:hypothetical protein
MLAAPQITGTNAGRRAMNRTLGIILIALSYTTREKVVDIGPIHATRDKTNTVPLPPIAGALALVGGIVLVAAGGRK